MRREVRVEAADSILSTTSRTSPLVLRHVQGVVNRGSNAIGNRRLIGRSFFGGRVIAAICK